ncbi:MAG: DUF1080 domain-containing protein [Candidatus Hydrogenedentota bacterium]
MKGFLPALLVGFSLVACARAQSEEARWVDTRSDVPSDAVVIFGGEDTDMLVAQDGGRFNWEMKDGAIVVKPGQQERQQGLWTKLHFRDAQIHIEFSLPKSDDPGTKATNSGLYFHGLFELQIIDGFENPMDAKEVVGSVYNIRPPLVNAARPTDTWQVYDIVFRAPRRDKDGVPTEAGSITAFLNGVLVQDHTPIIEHQSEYAPMYFRTTTYTEGILKNLLKTGVGPLQLQDHDHPVRFRNFWIRPLDDKAFMWNGKKAKRITN